MIKYIDPEDVKITIGGKEIKGIIGPVVLSVAPTLVKGGDRGKCIEITLSVIKWPIEESK